MLENTGHKTN